MTFIQGERREEAFEEQEERRALSIHDKRDAAAALDALLGVVKEAAALAVAAAEAGGAAADAGDFAAASLKAEDAERHAGAAFSAMGALARVGFDDRCAASKACYEGRVDASVDSTHWFGGSHQTSELSISVTSKSIRLIFGRIDCSRRVLEAWQKASRRNRRLSAH